MWYVIYYTPGFSVSTDMLQMVRKINKTTAHRAAHIINDKDQFRGKRSYTLDHWGQR